LFHINGDFFIIKDRAFISPSFILYEKFIKNPHSLSPLRVRGKIMGTLENWKEAEWNSK